MSDTLCCILFCSHAVSEIRFSFVNRTPKIRNVICFAFRAHRIPNGKIINYTWLNFDGIKFSSYATCSDHCLRECPWIWCHMKVYPGTQIYCKWELYDLIWSCFIKASVGDNIFQQLSKHFIFMLFLIFILGSSVIII